MKILLLRGKVPTDRDPKEIAFNSLDESDDIYEHIACQLGNESAEVLYWGGKRLVLYAENLCVRWIPDFRKHTRWIEPDVIWARGGFDEYRAILKKSPNAIKIYYGAGKRFLPDIHTKYDLTLQDSFEQHAIAQNKFPDMKHVIWPKPAAPMFTPMEVEKKYDICFIANGTQKDIKGIPFIYNHIPRNLKCLHLGLPSDLNVPNNVTCKRVLKKDMPKYINQCRVGVVPYKEKDSAPRAMAEMIACGLPVVALDRVRAGETLAYITTKECFWDTVENILDKSIKVYSAMEIRNWYNENMSIPVAVDFLRRVINGIKKDK